MRPGDRFIAWLVVLNEIYLLIFLPGALSHCVHMEIYFSLLHQWIPCASVDVSGPLLSSVSPISSTEVAGEGARVRN